MSLNEANELKIIVETWRQMINMFFVLGKECRCNQCVVSADKFKGFQCEQNIFVP